MNILHVCPYYAPAWTYGGVVSAVTGLTTAQAALGHKVTVLTTDALDMQQRNPVRYEKRYQVAIYRCRNLSNRLRARYNFSLPFGFRQQFQELVSGADIIHVHELRTVENLLINYQHGKSVVLSPHGTLPYGTGRSLTKRGWDALFGKSLLRRIDHVAALTTAEEAEARALWTTLRVPFPGTSIVPNGVPDKIPRTEGSEFRGRYGFGGGPVVMFLGRLHERKGLQYLIPAFAAATAEQPNARLLIVGPDAGMLTQAQALAAESGVAERTVFTGLLAGDDRWAALAAADLFVLPAVGEGFSMAALEAMAAGLPLIVTPGCNLPEIETRGAGLLVERAVPPLSAAITGLLADAERRYKMGALGQEWVHNAFTWPIIAAATENMYRQIIDKRQAKPR